MFLFLIPPRRLTKTRFTFFLLSALVSACGGGGGDRSVLGGNSNALLATQIAEVQPDNATDTTSVFVQLGSADSLAAGAQVASEFKRQQLQNQFLANLEEAIKPKVLLGISTSAPCDLTTFQQQLANAHKFSTDAALRLDLTACQLNLLKSIPSVKNVFPDIVLDRQAFGTPTSQQISAFNYLNNAIDFSFNNSSNRQIATSNGDTKTANGNGVVVAVLDTGVEERHPALGNDKVLPGACFSTASNGSISFCSQGNQQFEDPNNTNPNNRVARSCADALTSSGSAWSSRDQAVSAGCEHGTAMASAIAMSAANPFASVNVRGGIAPQAKILPIQVFNKAGNSISASSGDLLAALEWLASEAQRRKDRGLPPIVAANMSLGGGSYGQNCDNDYVGGLFNTAFDKLRKLGVLPVVAAGNSGNKSAVTFPACASNALSVAATQLDGLTPASYSNFSSQVKVWAIGGESNVTSEYELPTLCSVGNNFDCWNTIAGTSPATALVSGGVAALASLQPNAAAIDIESALLSASGGSAKTTTLNGMTRPVLRLTASGYKLMGTTEPSGSNTSAPLLPNPIPKAPATRGRACLFPKINYQGTSSCYTFVYGSDSTKWSNMRAGSVTIEPIGGGVAPPNTTTVTFFNSYWDYFRESNGKSISQSISDTSALGFPKPWNVFDSRPNLAGFTIRSQ